MKDKSATRKCALDGCHEVGSFMQAGLCDHHWRFLTPSMQNDFVEARVYYFAARNRCLRSIRGTDKGNPGPLRKPHARI